MDSTVTQIFFNGVKGFYRAVSSTIIKKFSFDDNLVDDVAFLLPQNQDKVTTALILRLACRFSAATPPDCLDALEEETLDYILLPSSSLPSPVGNDNSEQSKNDELCAYWQQIGKMTTLGSTARFPNLSRLAKCILSLPVSNADTERVFSIVRKIITEYRTQMDQSTLCALLACKMNSDYKCYDLATPSDLLRNAKSATMEYNRAHSSKFQTQ